MANTTWNPSDKSASITLTGSNLIATNSTGVAGSARAIDKQVTGKFYWETTVNARASTVGFPCGVWSSNIALSSNPGQTGLVGICGVGFTGSIQTDGVAGVSLGAIVATNVVCIAVDCAARLIWFRIGAAGNWNGSATANPATGAGGVAINSLGAGIPLYPGTWLLNTNDQITANFGGSAFTGTVPSGFASGFTSGVTTSTNALATQAALEAWVARNPAAQVTQAGLEAWYANGIAQVPAQVTQVGIEMWASVALYTPPPFVPPPPPPGPGKGHGHGTGGKGGGQPKIQFGSPALQGEVERFEAFKPRHKHRALGIFPPAITVLTLSEGAAATAALAATVIHVGSLSASAASSDAITAGRLLTALLAEGATTSAVLAAALTAHAILSESGHGTDSPSATARMLAALAASSVTSDTPHHGDAFPGMLAEGSVTSAAITAFLASKALLAEGVTTNAAVAGFRTLLTALAETGHGSDALSALARHGAALAEGSAAQDALSATAKLLAALTEAAQAQDWPAATAILRAALADGAGTVDADTFVATTHPLRHSAKLIGRHDTPDLEGEWREPNG